MKSALLALTLLATELFSQDTTARRPAKLCALAFSGTRCVTYLVTDLTLEKRSRPARSPS